MIIFGRNSFVLGLTGIQSNYFIAARSVLCFEFLFKTHQWFFTIIEQYLHSVKFFSLPSFIFISKLPNTPVSRLKVVRRLGAPQPGQQFQTDQWELPQHVMLCLGINAHEMTEERECYWLWHLSSQTAVICGSAFQDADGHLPTDGMQWMNSFFEVILFFFPFSFHM